MKVIFGKDLIEVEPELTSTISQLKAYLSNLTKCNSIRLILGGKTLLDEMMIRDIPGGLLSKITMVGDVVDIDALNRNTVPAYEVKNDFHDNINNISEMGSRGTPIILSRSRNLSLAAASDRQNPYKFHLIQTLQHLPEEHKAKSILNHFANDSAFIHILKKHKWSVGTLAELYPEGLVGESEVCLMGLNEGKGQRILLRLRTDDMQGFRKILSIKKVGDVQYMYMCNILYICIYLAWVCVI